MDSKGWISIPLIASFNRIKHLTNDLTMVKNVLSLSSIVEVKEEHVRLNNRQWSKYILPSAARSPYEEEDVEEEEEEDDIVFVLGGEGDFHDLRLWRADNWPAKIASGST